MYLPRMKYADGIRKYSAVTFGGYNHTLSARDGEIFDMKNLTGDYYPVLSPRKKRRFLRTLAKPNGIYGRDGLYWVDGTGFYKDGALKGTVEDSPKTFESLGAYIIILPDKKVYNSVTDELTDIERSWEGSVKIQDGTYAGEPAKANTIYAAGVNWAEIFQEGDGVTISGCVTHEYNNRTPIIQEIDGEYLHFLENAFEISTGGDSETVTIKREMPDLDYICQNENRLWGVKGDAVYACKQGDPFKWNVFAGIATDSYGAEVGSAEDFSGIASYLGYPVCFKSENIYKVYGDRPANFQIMGSATLGVADGSHRSLAIAGETLFYLSRVGIVAYTGGMPANLAAPFGDARYKNAVAGSDGVKYYISMESSEGWELFVYDTRSGLFHKEDNTHVLGWAWNDGLYMLTAGGEIWITGESPTIPEGTTEEAGFTAMAEFADFIESDPNKKGTGKIQVRMELEAGASVKIEMLFDSDGAWQEVKTLTTAVKRSFYLPIIPRRSDHFKIRFTGEGDWKLYSLVRESYSGSEL